MKATRLKAYGDVDQFVYEANVPDAAPAAGEVLVKVAGSGFNPVDLYVRMGYLAQNAPMPLPAILGLDVAGTIVALGEGVTGFAVGDRVVGNIGVTGRGSNAELAPIKASLIARVPAAIDLVAASVLPVAGCCGYQAVTRTLKSKAGDRVLVSGALGGVGRAAVFALKRAGAVPVAAVRPGQEAIVARELGVETFTLGSTPTTRFDGAVDTKGGDTVLQLFALLKDGGIIATAAGVPDTAPKDGPVTTSAVFGQSDPADLTAMLEGLASGALAMPITHRLTLDKVAEGHAMYARGEVKGKLVFVP